MAESVVFLIEPYYGGSHRHFMDGLQSELQADFHLFTLPASKWKWRVRSAPILASRWAAALVAGGVRPDVILCSSMLNLAEFAGLCPEVAGARTIAYFHENQLTYPVREEKERDLHFGLSNVLTALAADTVLFNSEFNRRSFLDAIPWLWARMPDNRPTGVVESVEARSRVLAPPIDYSAFDKPAGTASTDGPVRVLWNHRWEHDKNPDEFFRVLAELAEAGLDFEVVVLGECFAERPPIFDEARRRLGERVVHFGFEPDRRRYAALVGSCDVAVSTAGHEFFGMATLEAAYAGCDLIVPDGLAYRELFPDECRYRSRRGLVRMLRGAIMVGRGRTRGRWREIARAFGWEALRPEYRRLIGAQSKPPVFK